MSCLKWFENICAERCGEALFRRVLNNPIVREKRGFGKLFAK